MKRFGLAALAMILAVAADPPQAEAQCASYSCWRLSGSGKEGYACMMGGLMGQSTCVATTSGCLRSPCGGRRPGIIRWWPVTAPASTWTWAAVLCV